MSEPNTAIEIDDADVRQSWHPRYVMVDVPDKRRLCAMKNGSFLFVNQQGKSWPLTLVEAAHWLGRERHDLPDWMPIGE